MTKDLLIIFSDNQLLCFINSKISSQEIIMIVVDQLHIDDF